MRIITRIYMPKCDSHNEISSMQKFNLHLDQDSSFKRRFRVKIDKSCFFTDQRTSEDQYKELYEFESH